MLQVSAQSIVVAAIAGEFREPEKHFARAYDVPNNSAKRIGRRIAQMQNIGNNKMGLHPVSEEFCRSAVPRCTGVKNAEDGAENDTG